MKQLTRLEFLDLTANPVYNTALEKPPGCPLAYGDNMSYGGKEYLAPFLACLP